jgi:hypothetical protein
MPVRTYPLLVAVFCALLGATAGYLYATTGTDKVLTELELLNQANKITSGLQTIELTDAGNVVAIKAGQERLIRLAVITLKGLDVDPDPANKSVIVEALSRLKDYQSKKSGAVDPDVEMLLQRLR